MFAEVLIFIIGALAILLTLLAVYGGSMDAKMQMFTLIITVTTGVFSVAVYRNVVRKLQGIWQHWHGIWSLSDLNMVALARAFVIEVLLQRKLYRDDRVRWVRHVFVYWGFVGLWFFDMVFFFSTRVLHLPRTNPFRLFLDFGLDLYGGILLLGLAAALIRAYFVRGSKGSIYNDTPAVLLLFVVVVTGFLVEAVRLVALPFEPHMAWSFLGLAMALALRGLNWQWASLYESLWIFHAVIASVFIVYIPLSRMVHVFAVPLGRLLESQQGILAAKVRSIGRGLMGR